MLHHLIGIRGQRPLMALMPGFGAARPGLLPPFFAIRGWRLRRGARGLLGRVPLQHQLDQFLLAQALQIAAAHTDRESVKPSDGKGGRPDT